MKSCAPVPCYYVEFIADSSHWIPALSPKLQYSAFIGLRYFRSATCLLPAALWYAPPTNPIQKTGAATL